MSVIVRRKLYEKSSNSNYGDNWTDENYMSGLRTVDGSSTNILQRFLDAISVTAPLNDQFTLIALILIVFNQLQEKSQVPTGIIIAIFLLNFSTLGYNAELEKDQWQSAILILLLGYLLSPGLRTLTDSISTDTIYATVVLAFLVHLATRDYQDTNAGGGGALSLNAALFASLCLASRLSTPFQAFALLSMAAATFSLLPMWLSHIRSQHKQPLLQMISLSVLTYVCLLYYSKVQIAVIFTIFVSLCNVLCPFLYVQLHRFKYNIYGPWDEGVL